MYKFLVEKYILTFFVYEMFKVKMKNCKLYQKYIYIGSKNSKYRGQIIVVHVHANVFFSKVNPACHNIVNGIKQGSDSEKD